MDVHDDDEDAAHEDAPLERLVSSSSRSPAMAVMVPAPARAEEEEEEQVMQVAELESKTIDAVVLTAPIETAEAPAAVEVRSVVISASKASAAFTAWQMALARSVLQTVRSRLCTFEW